MRLFYKISFIFVAYGFLYFTNSCKKEEDKSLVITGIITDGNQHTPIADAEVTFWVSRLQNGTYNPNLTPLLTVNTDLSGNYNFNLTKEKDAAYRITVEKAQYFGQTIDINVDDLPTGNHNLNYSILPEAFIKLHVKNVYYYNNNDVIGYSFSNTQPVGSNCCNNQSTTGIGLSYENTIVCKTYGAQKINVSWSTKKNGINTMFDSLIYCIPFDTTTFNLFY